MKIRFGELAINHDAIIIDGRIIDLNTLQVEVSRIILFQHPLCEVRDVLSGIAFSSDINLVALHAEGLDEPSPEVVELVRDIDLILDSGGTRRVTRASRLINIDHIGQLVPRIWIPDGLVDAWLPEEWPIFLEHAN